MVLDGSEVLHHHLQPRQNSGRTNVMQRAKDEWDSPTRNHSSGPRLGRLEPEMETTHVA